MRTTFTRAAITLRILTFACVVALTAFLGPAGTDPAAADETGVVDEGCAVPEPYPNDGVPCVPSTDDPVPGGDEPICYAPVGELDCGPDTIDDGDCQDPAGCSVPGDPGSGGGCDPATSDCGTVIDVEPPGDGDPGDDVAPPCSPEWMVEGGCVIPIGTVPGEGDPGGGIPPCPDGGKSCVVPEPAPIVGIGVSGGAVDEGLPLTGEADNAGADRPAAVEAAPVDDAAMAGICSSSCNVTSGLSAETTAPDDDATLAPGDLTQPGFGIALGRLDSVQGTVAGTPAAVIATVLAWLRAFLLP